MTPYCSCLSQGLPVEPAERSRVRSIRSLWPLLGVAATRLEQASGQLGRSVTLGHLDPGVCFVGDVEPIECLPEGFLGGYKALRREA